VPATKTSGKLGQFPAQAKSWSASGLANNLQVAPADAVPPSYTYSFHSRLFGSETGGQTLSSIRPGSTVADLFWSEDAGKEAPPKAFHGSLDPGDLGDVNSCAYNHLAPIKVP
jgi:hypothetical protein